MGHASLKTLGIHGILYTSGVACQLGTMMRRQGGEWYSMIYLAVCDDNIAHLEYTCRFVQNTAAGSHAVIEQYHTAKALLLAMTNNEYRADIAILDIGLDDLDGIALAKRIHAMDPSCQIIFLSGHLPYATQVYEVEHTYFVLKSEMKLYLESAIEKALRSREQALHNMLVVKVGTDTVVLACTAVLYLERVVRKTNVITKDGASYLTTQTPAVLLQSVTVPFIRCHQSFYVNPANVLAMGQDSFTLANGQEIPISRSFRKEARASFFKSFQENKFFL